VYRESFVVLCHHGRITVALEVEELVGDLFDGEPVEHDHDPSGEFEVGGTAVRDENPRMGALFVERGLVESFIVATIVGEYRVLVG